MITTLKELLIGWSETATEIVMSTPLIKLAELQSGKKEVTTMGE